MTLYHYTCDHGFAGIRDSGWVLRPWGVPGLPQLVWSTDLDVPVREGLGLRSKMLDCDRTQHRLTIAPDAEHLAEHWATARRRFLPTYVEALESNHGAMPQHWWVARVPLTVVP